MTEGAEGRYVCVPNVRRGRSGSARRRDPCVSPGGESGTTLCPRAEAGSREARTGPLRARVLSASRKLALGGASRAGRLSAPRAARPQPSALETRGGLGAGRPSGCRAWPWRVPGSGRELERAKGVRESGGGSGELPKRLRALGDPGLPERCGEVRRELETLGIGSLAAKHGCTELSGTRVSGTCGGGYWAELSPSNTCVIG